MKKKTKYNTALLERYLDTFGIKLEKEYRYIPGRKFRADYAIPIWRILIEVQGGVYDHRAHGSISGILKDNLRLNFATIYGWQLFRITPDQFHRTQAIDFLEFWCKQRGKTGLSVSNNT